MKKTLGKKIGIEKQTIETYACTCSGCSCSCNCSADQGHSYNIYSSSMASMQESVFYNQVYR